MAKNIYPFDNYPLLLEELGSPEKVHNLLGEKASILTELQSIGIEIPNGFIVSTAVYPKFIENDANQFPDDVWKEIKSNINEIENKSGLKFGDAERPLFLSCRCDAPLPMPGMLDCVLNIGLTDLTCRAIEKMTRNRGFAFDSYRRLIQGYGTVVLKIPIESFEDLFENFRLSRRYSSTAEFNDKDWIEVTKLYKSVIMKKTGNPFPQNPEEQLKRILNATYASFNSEKSKLYREFIKMPENLNPSLIISQMVFGNNGNKSASAIMYTRNPITGASEIYGEYSVNALIEDVSRGFCPSKEFENLQTDLSNIEYNSIKEITEKIEKHYGEPQMIDFVIDNGKVVVLQARPLSFQSTARFEAIKDMATSGLITKEEALSIIRPEDLKQLMLPQLQSENPPQPFCTGLSAGNGSVLGRVCLSAEAVSKAKNHPILFCKELLPKDFKTYLQCDAIVTCKGGNSSHAALIARQLMRTAVINCENLVIDKQKKIVTCNDQTLKEKDIITVTGDGKVIKGKQNVAVPLGFDNPAASEILKWADEARKGKIDIYSIVSTSKEAAATAALGADGVGIFPIESVFTGKGGTLIKALSDKRRAQALSKMEPVVTKIVFDTFSESNGIPVTFRLFKPTLSSFSQDLFSLVEEVAKLKAKKEATDEEEFNEDKDLTKKIELLDSIKESKEANPLFGLKGIRLNIVQQDFLKVQLRSILNGIKQANEKGVKADAKILLPMVTAAREVQIFRELYDQISTELMATASIGVELENPRACASACSISKNADFILLQSTDLTETTFSCSKSYAEKTFLKDYINKKFFSKDPFETLDIDSVGELMKLAASEAKKEKSDIPVGIAGDLCGDQKSIEFFYSIGANSITCKSTVVPIARLCSAQAVINSTKS